MWQAGRTPRVRVEKCTGGFRYLYINGFGYTGDVLMNEPKKEILQYLKKHGERLDTEIAEATGLPFANVRIHLSELAAKGEIMACHSTKFEKGKKIEGISCRVAGYIPPAAPGRKSKAQLKIS